MDSGARTSPVTEGEPVLTTVLRAPELPLPAIAWFLGLLILLYFPVLKTMVVEWATDENLGHAFFVPVLAGYLVWLDRQRILAAPVRRCWPALTLVVWGFCQMLLGFLGANFFLARTAFLIAIVGVIWTLAGRAVLRSLVFPLFLLLFMIRIPLYVYQQITFPLQILASEVAARGLEILGIPVFRDGNVLQLAGHKLEVVEACSGIRSLLSLTFLSVAYGRLFERRLWMKIVLFLLTVPIAIGCNAARVTLTGVLTQYSPDIAEGAYHTFEGWVIFMVELVVLLGAHRLLSWLFGKSQPVKTWS
jgi:exosortase